MTKCRDCPYFHIEYMPLKSGGLCWDSGRARCDKYNLVVDFISSRQLDKLTCKKVQKDDER